MTAALEGAEWSAARPGPTLPPGKTRYPFYRRLGGPQSRSGRVENLAPAGIRSRTVQPIVSRYTGSLERRYPKISVILLQDLLPHIDFRNIKWYRYLYRYLSRLTNPCNPLLYITDGKR